MITAKEAKENVGVRKAKEQASLMASAEMWLEESVSPAITKASKEGLTFCNVDLVRFDHNEEALTFIGRTLTENGFRVKRFARSTLLQILWED